MPITQQFEKLRQTVSKNGQTHYAVACVLILVLLRALLILSPAVVIASECAKCQQPYHN